MPLSHARRIAYEVLRRVEAHGAYASDELHEALDAKVKPNDAALATEIVFGVLRWRRLLDFLLDRHLKKPVERLDLAVALALRISLYQLRFLERIPARAAVNESVELVKAARKTSAAALVNAVLHKVATESRTSVEQLLRPKISQAERLAILHSHPTWMVERWIKRLGEEQTASLLTANNEKPRLSIALQDSARRDEVFREFAKVGMRIEPGLLLNDAFAVSGGSPTHTEAFRSGLISIQDEASQTVPLLLDVKAGDRVLDLCAAPGGKTPPLARAAGQTGRVVAADRYTHRLGAMRAQFERIKLQNVESVELDAEKPLRFEQGFDRILVDAPCSGTGTLARHPEIRWRLRPEQLLEFHALQIRILGNAIPFLAPKGRLLYSTCSLEPEENENVIGEILEGEKSVRRVPQNALSEALQPYLAASVDARTLFGSSGNFGTSPASHTDGFFAAAIEKI
jgi:16S rRNA (cytosine967-C5)-methyltransferase